jgi:hypothetical protein
VLESGLPGKAAEVLQIHLAPVYDMNASLSGHDEQDAAYYCIWSALMPETWSFLNTYLANV